MIRPTSGGWREVRDELEMTSLVGHTLRNTVASFLDDAAVPVRKISHQLGHTKISTTQDSYLRRRLTDRQTVEVLEALLDPTVPEDRKRSQYCPSILSQTGVQRGDQP